MLEKILKNGYGYSIDHSGTGVGIVLAENEKDARAKIIKSYMKHGYIEDSFVDLEIWKLDNNCFFADSPDILEIY